MIVIPIQFFGLGDVIFCQTLVRHQVRQDDKIIWPVEPHFVEGLNRAYPDITFVDKNIFSIDYNAKKEIKTDTYRTLPLRWADTILGVPYTQCMSSKYDLYGMDYRWWTSHASWHRDIVKEVGLYNEFRIKKDEEYILTNRFFGSNSQFKADIPYFKREVAMVTMPGYSLFDWRLLLMNAKEIHTVSTSIIYMLEIMEIGSKIVHLYPRKPIEQDFRNVEYILTKPNYILHT